MESPYPSHGSSVGRRRRVCRSSRRGVGRRRPGTTGDTLVPWTSDPPTPTGSRASPPARCRSPSPIPATNAARGPRAGASLPRGRRRCGRLPRADACPATRSTTWSCRTRSSTPCVERLETVVEASRDLLPGARRRRTAAARQPALQLRGRDPPRRGARRRPEVLPAELPRVLRAALVRPGRRPARLDDRRSAAREAPFGPDLIFEADRRAAACVVHVEICEDMWVPVPPSAEAALAGATVLANLSGSPITVARAEDRRLLVPLRERALPRGLRLRRGGPGRVDAPTCRGTARPWSTRSVSCSARPSGSPTGRAARSPTSTSTGSARSGCGRAPSTTTAGRTPPTRRLPRRRLHSSTRPTGDIGLRRKVDRFPFVPDDAERLAPGLLRGLQHPGLRARAAAARDRPSRRSSSASPAGSTRPTR